MNAPRGRFPHFLLSFVAVLLAALLFAASFPNLLFPRGISLLAWIAAIPLFWLSYRLSLGAAVFFGALYGYAAYGLFNYWLSVFHPLAGLIVGVIYLAYFALFLPLLRLAILLFPRRGYILQWILWIAFEYLRTLGFLGYPYGIMGYSQWYMLPLIQIAGIFGVWGVSALVVFPSAYMAAALRGILSRRAEPGRTGPAPLPPGAFFRRERLPALLYLAALGSALIYGAFSLGDYPAAPTARIALIQHNTDPWRGDIEDYRQNFRVLRRLSDEALAADPKPDLVAWSETAFVPRIYWHQTYRDDQASYLLVKELLDYLKDQEVPFIIGNDDARREITPQGVWDRVDYNGALLFHRGKLLDQYRKLRLVPFTEYFPYEKQLPWVYEALKNADTHFWKKGEEVTVFSINGLKFSTPICFEDSFGYISRDFVKAGAEIIVNLTNDAWSGSLPAQMQHMAMAVFRAVENRRSLVRSTASGQTCGIDPGGRLLAMAEPFAEVGLTVEVPVVTGAALYTRWGDFFAQIFTVLGIIVLIGGLGRGIIKRNRQGGEDERP
ncbi:MAG: apolipoprotein N-acyltransferase [Spirochaetaceae bacterium]|jgi:apolipoprotein N-acyltransferase|nr:apolipoprotein N-acyltransferase [Spirochaetaceae bacterium]